MSRDAVAKVCQSPLFRNPSFVSAVPCNAKRAKDPSSRHDWTNISTPFTCSTSREFSLGREAPGYDISIVIFVNCKSQPSLALLTAGYFSLSSVADVFVQLEDHAFLLTMGKIRVKVVVLPSSPSVREEVIAPWIEPCSEDLSLQVLCEKIVDTFADLHEGKG